MTSRILLVDDEPSIRFVLEKALAKAGLASESAASAEEARQLLRDGGGQARYPVVLLDVRLPGDSGFQLLEELRALPAPPRVVVMTAQDTLRAAMTAMRLGADEYLVKPFELGQVVSLVQALLEKARSQEEDGSPPAPQPPPPASLVGRSLAMVELSKQLGRAAASSLNVLITGESGTGKELVARAIHDNSARAKAPFVTVNAAAIPRELLESELYGHEKGAFTSAAVRHRGKFEQADGGTLFLDEIGELPIELQAKLLRAIQERSIDRVGGERSQPVDVRVIAATNAELERLVQEGRFRGDLYYRLSVLLLHLPPLRDRPEDLLPLAEHFLDRHAGILVGRRVHLGAGAEAILRAHPWPGNVRELENVVQRALVSSRDGQIEASVLAAAIGSSMQARPVNLRRGNLVPRQPGGGMRGEDAAELPEGRAYAAAVEEAERRVIRMALERFEGNQVRAARWLGINRNTLRAKVRALELEVDPKI